MGMEISETGRQGQESETRGKQGQMERGQRWVGDKMEGVRERDQGVTEKG